MICVITFLHDISLLTENSKITIFQLQPSFSHRLIGSGFKPDQTYPKSRTSKSDTGINTLNQLIYEPLVIPIICYRYYTTISYNSVYIYYLIEGKKNIR